MSMRFYSFFFQTDFGTINIKQNKIKNTLHLYSHVTSSY